MRWWILFLLLLPFALAMPQVSSGTNKLPVSSTSSLDKNSPVPPETSPASANKIVYVVEGNTPPSQSEIKKMAEATRESNGPVEVNNYVVERHGNLLYIRPTNTPKVAERKLPSYVSSIAKKMGLEVNGEVLKRSGKIVVRIKKKNLLEMRMLVRRAGLAIGKAVLFDENAHVADVNILISVDKNGLYFLEENIPKGEGNVELNLHEGYLVVKFDPVIAWVVRLEANKVEMVHYTVRTSVPPEIEPTVARLASCDVKVKFLDIGETKKGIGGKFQILLSDIPVYTPDVRLNGTYTFVRDGMYYVFETNGPKLVLDGRVGDCSFHRELTASNTDYTVLAAIAFVVLAIAAYFLIR